ncbi:MAG: hypothetical protein E6Q27_07165 [Aeromicrobium sp.]|nr:MAG: hypothetical protein E6Q27_07165 [Aeromicrobium sp.]
MRLRVVTAVLAVLALGACAAPGEQHLVDKEKPTSAPTTATPPVDERAPLRPAMQRSAVGAEAQVRYALEVIEYARATGETDDLLELSREGCIPCADAYDLIRADDVTSIVTETVVSDSTTLEGEFAQTDTVVATGSTDRQRSWRLLWDGEGWEYRSLTGILPTE